MYLFVGLLIEKNLKGKQISDGDRMSIVVILFLTLSMVLLIGYVVTCFLDTVRELFGDEVAVSVAVVLLVLIIVFWCYYY